MNNSILYPYVLFLHVLGAMALVAFYGLEWAALMRLQRVTSARRIPDALAPMQAGRVLISISGPTLFLTGLYMTWAAWDWLAPWVGIGFAAMILLAVLGGKVTGSHIQGLIASGGADLQARLAPMWTSFLVRVALLAGVIFVMCVKPGLVGSLVVMALCAASGWWYARRMTRPAAATPPREDRVGGAAAPLDRTDG